MTEPSDNGHPPDEATLAGLGRGWDALLAGDSAEKLHPDDLATIRTLQTLATAPPPRPAFARMLKENLMNAPLTARPHQSAPIYATFPPHPSTARENRRSWSLGRAYRAFSTALLFAIMLAGVGMVALRPIPLVPTPSGMGALTGNGETPTPQTDWTCQRTDPFSPCPEAVTTLGTAVFRIPNGDQTILAANRVQLQDWRIEPGGVSSGTPDVLESGASVDVVLEGAYSASFHVTVNVYRHFAGGSSRADVIDGGRPVELGVGDAVAFPVGSQSSLTNPLAALPLRFKRAVFSADDHAFFQFRSGASPEAATATVIGLHGLTITNDGEFAMSGTLGSLSTTELSFELDYVRIPAGATFPPKRYGAFVAIGPVAPEPWEGSGTVVEGYVMLVEATKG